MLLLLNDKKDVDLKGALALFVLFLSYLILLTLVISILHFNIRLPL